MNKPNPQFTPTQPIVIPTNVPFLAPMMPIPDMRQPTAEEFIKKVEAEVRAEKEKERQAKLDLQEANLPKCDLHPKKLSPNCRKCKKIKEQMEEIERKKQQEKEKFNPENHLREILNEGSNAPQEEKARRNPHMPLPIWGDGSTFNMNELLRTNIKNSPYFNELYSLRTIPEILDEITKKATHAEPWLSGHTGTPSTFFCCLYRLMMMRLTESQIRELIDYKGSPYVRCAGFLYLRYCCNPEHLWDWVGKYLLDEEELHPAADANVVMSVGEYVEMLLIEMNYYNTIFPRIPVVIDREIKKNILIMRERRFRKRKNQDHFDQFVKGAKIMAISPEDNDWHEATLVRVEGRKLRVKFTNVKEQHDDADFTLELLEKKFQGEDVFIGGDEVLVDLGEVMTPEDTIEYLKSLGDLQEEEEKEAEEKSDKMEVIEPATKATNEEGLESRKKKDRSPSSSASEERLSSSDRRDKRRSKKRKHRGKKHRSPSSSSESSSSSGSSSRSRSKHRKRKEGKKEKKRKEKGREKERERDKKKDKERARKKEKAKREESSSASPAKSKSKERVESPKKEKVEKVEKKKPEVKVKDKTDKYMERVLKMQAEGASARSKAEYAARPVSYKTSLSTNVPGGGRRKQSRSPSPDKKVVVIKKEGQRRDDDDYEVSKQKQPSAEYLEKMRKLKEQYGESKDAGSTLQKNRDLAEGPDVLKLGS